MRYRKKPVVIDAVKWLGNNLIDLDDLAEGSDIDRPIKIVGSSLMISTLEGDMKASIGDYVIKGVQGELYPCKPDIFEQTYEALEGE